MTGIGEGPRRRRSSGFSLVELAVALTVLLTAVLAAIRTQLTSVDLIRTRHETALAAADLRTAMEGLLRLPPSSIPLPGGPYAPDQPIAQFEGLHLNGESVVPTYPGTTAGAPIPDPLPIVLTITWTDFAGRSRSMRLATLRTG